MEQKKEKKKIDYFIAENIRFLYNNKKEVIKKEFIEDNEIITFPFSKESLCQKHNLTEKCFDAIIKRKIYKKPPKQRKIIKQPHLTKGENELIINLFNFICDGKIDFDKDYYFSESELNELREDFLNKNGTKSTDRKKIMFIIEILHNKVIFKRMDYLKLYRIIEGAKNV